MNHQAPSNRFFNRARTAMALGLLAWPLLLAGQTNLPEKTYPANRYLLVVETSRSMQQRVEPMLQAVRDLLGTSLAGQARPGDSLGVWTFNDEVYTGQLPLQQCSPEAQTTIVKNVTAFLAAQKFEKRARYAKLMPMLDRVVKGSPFITVILVCFGDEEIHGTPFDARINEFFRTWHLRKHNEGTPFVIAFRGQNGRLVDCSMNPSPWVAELPALPKELLVPLPAPSPPLVKEAPSRPPTSTVPPLIISGKKREPVPATKPLEHDASNQTVAPAPNTIPVSAPPTVSSLDESSKAGTNPANLVANNAAPAPTSTAVSPGPQGVMPPPTAADRESSQGSSKTQAPEDLKPVATPPGQSTPQAEQGVPVSQAARPGSPERERKTPQTDRAVSKPPSQIATATAPSRGSHLVLLFGASALALLAAGSAILMWRRRSHHGDETSLITESIDRRKK